MLNKTRNLFAWCFLLVLSLMTSPLVRADDDPTTAVVQKATTYFGYISVGVLAVGALFLSVKVVTAIFHMIGAWMSKSHR